MFSLGFNLMSGLFCKEVSGKRRKGFAGNESVEESNMENWFRQTYCVAATHVLFD